MKVSERALAPAETIQTGWISMRAPAAQPLDCYSRRVLLLLRLFTAGGHPLWVTIAWTRVPVHWKSISSYFQSKLFDACVQALTYICLLNTCKQWFEQCFELVGCVFRKNLFRSEKSWHQFYRLFTSSTRYAHQTSDAHSFCSLQFYCSLSLLKMSKVLQSGHTHTHMGRVKSTQARHQKNGISTAQCSCCLLPFHHPTPPSGLRPLLHLRQRRQEGLTLFFCLFFCPAHQKSSRYWSIHPSLWN